MAEESSSAIPHADYNTAISSIALEIARKIKEVMGTTNPLDIFMSERNGVTAIDAKIAKMRARDTKKKALIQAEEDVKALEAALVAKKDELKNRKELDTPISEEFATILLGAGWSRNKKDLNNALTDGIREAFVRYIQLGDALKGGEDGKTADIYKMFNKFLSALKFEGMPDAVRRALGIRLHANMGSLCDLIKADLEKSADAAEGHTNTAAGMLDADGHVIGSKQSDGSFAEATAVEYIRVLEEAKNAALAVEPAAEALRNTKVDVGTILNFAALCQVNRNASLSDVQRKVTQASVYHNIEELDMYKFDFNDDVKAAIDVIGKALGEDYFAPVYLRSFMWCVRKEMLLVLGGPEATQPLAVEEVAPELAPAVTAPVAIEADADGDVFEDAVDELATQAVAAPSPDETRVEAVLQGVPQSGSGKQMGGKKTDTVQEADGVRQKLNTDFGKSLYDLYHSLTKEVVALTDNDDPRLVEYFSDASSKILLDELWEIRITSNAYIPMLSGYYHTPEAKARTSRFVETLQRASTRMTESIAAYDIAASGKNSISRIRDIIGKVVHLIEKSNDDMARVFARLAGAEVDRLVEGDNALARKGEAKDMPSSVKELSAFSGDEHNAYIKAVDMLKSKVSRAAARHAVLMDIDRFKNFMSKGGEIQDKAIEKRLADLRRDYDHDLAQAAADEKEMCRRFVDYKMEGLKKFYQLLKKTDSILMKSHIETVMKPGLKENLYAALADLQITQSREKGALEERMKKAVNELWKVVSDGNANALIDIANTHGAVDTSNEIHLTPLKAKSLQDVQRHLMEVFKFSPVLKNALRFANMLETNDATKFDVEEFYQGIADYIVISSIEFGTRDKALLELAAGEAGTFVPLGLDTNGNGQSIPNTPSTLSTRHQLLHTEAPLVKEEGTHLFLRTNMVQLTEEDELFVKMLKAITGRFLIKLDHHRADFGEKRAHMPRAEQYMIGGALGDLVAVSGSKDVIPEAVPLYVGLPLAIRLYKQHFSFDSQKHSDGKPMEPQLVIELPKASRFRPLMLSVYEDSSSTEANTGGYSEAFGRRLVESINIVWESFAGTVQDPRKRVTQIFDAFFDEVNNAVLLQTSMKKSKAEIDRTDEKTAEYSTLASVEDRPVDLKISEYEDDAYKQHNIKKSMFDALKNVSMSVFDILSKVDVTEAQMVADYKSFIERATKRVAESEAPKRFDELLSMLRNTDSTIGSVVTVFMAFNEFYITPLVLTLGLFEEVVYKQERLISFMRMRGVTAANNNNDTPAVRLYLVDALRDFVIPGTDYIGISGGTQAPAPRNAPTNEECAFKMNTTNFESFLEDALIAIREGLIPFSRLGDVEKNEKYIKEISEWKPQLAVKHITNSCNDLPVAQRHINSLLNVYGNYIPFGYTNSRGAQGANTALQFYHGIAQPVQGALDTVNITNDFKMGGIFSLNGTINSRPGKLTNISPLTNEALYNSSAFDVNFGFSNHEDLAVSSVQGFNHLLIHMITNMTIQGDEPVILYELASAITGNTSISRYFEIDTNSVSDPNAPAQTVVYPTFKHAIETPKLGLDGAIFSWGAKTAALNAVPPSPAFVGANAEVPFILDFCLYPFLNAMNSKTRKRIEDCTRHDISKYLAFIPQYITVLDKMIHTVELDKKFGFLTVQDGQGARTAGGYELHQDLYWRFNDGGVRLTGAHLDMARGISERFLPVIHALRDELVNVYLKLRESYGVSLHMERVRGDLDQFKTAAGNLDFNKIITPMSILQGFVNHDANGPLVYPNFGLGRWRDDAHALSWMLHRRVHGISKAVSLESLPWTVDMNQQLERLTGAKINLPLVIDFCVSAASMINSIHISQIAPRLQGDAESWAINGTYPNGRLGALQHNRFVERTIVRAVVPGAGANARQIGTQNQTESIWRSHNSAPDMDENDEVYKTIITTLRTTIDRIGNGKLWHINVTPSWGNATVDAGTIINPNDWLISSLLEHMKNPRSMYEKFMGYVADPANSMTTAIVELREIDPPKQSISTNVQLDRLTAAMFLFLKRNPVSPTVALSLVPFPSIHNFDQVFELYLKMSRLHERSTAQPGGRRALPWAHIYPLNGTGFMIRSVDSNGTWASETQKSDRLQKPYNPVRPLHPITIGNMAYISYMLAKVCGVSEQDSVRIRTTISGGNTNINAIMDALNVPVPIRQRFVDMITAVSEDGLRDFTSYSKGNTFIPLFYQTDVIAFCTNVWNTDPDVIMQRFPMFAMMIRALDQYGILIRDETRDYLKTLKTRKADQAVDTKQGVDAILGV